MHARRAVRAHVVADVRAVGDDRGGLAVDAPHQRQRGEMRRGARRAPQRRPEDERHAPASGPRATPPAARRARRCRRRRRRSRRPRPAPPASRCAIWRWGTVAGAPAGGAPCWWEPPNSASSIGTRSCSRSNAPARLASTWPVTKSDRLHASAASYAASVRSPQRSQVNSRSTVAARAGGERPAALAVRRAARAAPPRAPRRTAARRARSRRRPPRSPPGRARPGSRSPGCRRPSPRCRRRRTPPPSRAAPSPRRRAAALSAARGSSWPVNSTRSEIPSVGREALERAALRPVPDHPVAHARAAPPPRASRRRGACARRGGPRLTTSGCASSRPTARARRRRDAPPRVDRAPCSRASASTPAEFASTHARRAQHALDRRRARGDARGHPQDVAAVHGDDQRYPPPARSAASPAGTALCAWITSKGPARRRARESAGAAHAPQCAYGARAGARRSGRSARRARRGARAGAGAAARAARPARGAAGRGGAARTPTTSAPASRAASAWRWAQTPRTGSWRRG